MRSNMAKGELRRVMYELLDQALMAAGIGPTTWRSWPTAATAC